MVVRNGQENYIKKEIQRILRSKNGFDKEYLKSLLLENPNVSVSQFVSLGDTLSVLNSMGINFSEVERIFLLIRTGDERNYSKCMEIIHEIQRRTSEVIWNFEIDKSLNGVVKFIAVSK
ncbi:MAG: hypothetical protein DRP11_03395 [Candidatus Aenigmatarchaeota archaeon]|nr:MAG: hypothetical protein DRP11_03395 [Candidatus Aenigmarchaeota archaeon]